jgi:hypothetical protein
MHAPEAQSWLTPRFAEAPKKRSSFLGVEAWGERNIQGTMQMGKMGKRRPSGTRISIICRIPHAQARG